MSVEFECPECGSIEEPQVSRFKENDDADGNRGIWVRYERCSECGYEVGFQEGW